MKNHNVPKILKPFFLLVIIISMVTTTIPIHVTAATDCAHCGGTGDCSTCSGLGDCRSCFGSKEDICTRCFNGRCLNCGGEGVIKSYSSGKIKERKCSYCNNGKCRTCSGSGRISCSTCSGTGDCRTCSGDTECRYYDGYGVNYNTSSSNTSSSNTGSSNTSNNTTNSKPNSQYLYIDCTELTLTVGESYTFTVRGRTNDGKAYAVFDETFFKEAEDGSFTYAALKAGNSTIEFRSTDDTVSVSCKVTITENKQKTQSNSQYLEIDCTELTLTVGKSYTFTVSGHTNDGIAYAIFDETFFTEAKDGSFTYTALKAGTSIIEFRSTDDTVSVSCKVTVKEKKQNTQANSQYLELDCTELTLTVGETYTFNVTGKTNDGIIQTVYDTTFFKKEANRNFTYTALKAGTTTIEFRSEDNTVSVSCKVTIKEAKNTLMVTVDGTEEIFYLKSAEVVGKKIHVRYECYNPRGEEKYDLRLQFNNNMEVGTYKIPDSAITPTVIVYFDKANVTDSYCSYQKYNVRYPAKTKYTTIFTIEDMNEDWTTYTGTLETTLANRSNTVTLTLGKFNFTLGEQHDMTK